MSKPKTKKPPPYLNEGPSPSEEEREEETEDIYDTDTREEMVEEGEITPAEEGFMEGYEQEPPAKKETRKKSVNHDDTVSVKLAEKDAEDH